LSPSRKPQETNGWRREEVGGSARRDWETIKGIVVGKRGRGRSNVKEVIKARSKAER